MFKLKSIRLAGLIGILIFANSLHAATPSSSTINQLTTETVQASERVKATIHPSGVNLSTIESAVDVYRTGHSHLEKVNAKLISLDRMMSQLAARVVQAGTVESSAKSADRILLERLSGDFTKLFEARRALTYWVKTSFETLQGERLTAPSPRSLYLADAYAEPFRRPHGAENFKKLRKLKIPGHLHLSSVAQQIQVGGIEKLLAAGAMAVGSTSRLRANPDVVGKITGTGNIAQ